MPGRHQISAHVLTGAHQIPGGLLCHARDRDRVDLIEVQQSRQSRAFRASVLTRSPDGRCSFEGAATRHSMPTVFRKRASPNPVGPASYVAFTGSGNDRIHLSMSR